MRRGEIWTVSGGADYAAKPRPVAILQDDRFSTTGSLTVCPFTSDPSDAPLLRVAVTPSERNGLRVPCRLMADKVTTISKAKFGRRIGELDDDDIIRLNRAVLVFLGLAGPQQT